MAADKTECLFHGFYVTETDLVVKYFHSNLSLTAMTEGIM
jgi:hypothetical protein